MKRYGCFRFRAFTLIELLVVIAIVALLAALAFSGFQSVSQRRLQMTSLNNLRQIASAALAFSGENEGMLLARADSQKWPQSLNPYLGNTRIFADPGDTQNWVLTDKDPLTDDSNETSYIYNGFNDLGTYGVPTAPIRLTRIDAPSQTILFAIPHSGDGNFFMDLQEGNQSSILNLTTFDGGSTYAFADGSARFIKESAYVANEQGMRHGDRLWMGDKSYVLP